MRNVAASSWPRPLGMANLLGVANFHRTVDPATHLQRPVMELLHRVTEVGQLVFRQTVDLAFGEVRSGKAASCN